MAESAPRRAAPRESSRRTAAETRERILEAAVAEFGAKGYAGARTAEIAARAGVNQQLIAYHFGGKQGLLDELRTRWAETERAARPAGGSTYADSLRAYLDLTLDRPDWSRLVVWRALGDDPGSQTPGASAESDSGVETGTRPSPRPGAGPETVAGAEMAPHAGAETARHTGAETGPEAGAAPGLEAGAEAAQSERMRAAVEGIARRQRDGEISPELDPAFVLLLSYAMTFAPIALPHFVADILGVDPLSADYRDLCVDQLVKLLTPASERPTP